MRKKYILILLSLALCLFFTEIQAQQMGNEKITIESMVTDGNKIPIAGAIIYGNEGAVKTITDSSGKFILIVPVNTEILIQAAGYESGVFTTEFYLNGGSFILESSKPLFGEKDLMNVAFGKVYKGNITNAINSIDAAELLTYDNIQTVYDAISGRIPGMYSSTNMRGMGEPVFIVDGLPRDPYFINLSEVDQITILKDVNSSILFGNSALNGVVLVTTKRGEMYKRKINVSAHYGISKPRALPKYLSSANYMELYNEARQNDGLAPQYNDELIRNYREGNPYRYPDVDYYSDEYLKDVKPYSRVMVDLSGGNRIATYYSDLSWDNEGSLLDFGAGKSGHRNSFNARGNVDMKVNNWINTSLDAVAYIRNTKGPRNDYWQSASVYRPDRFSPLIPIDLIDPDLELLKAHKNDIDGKYLLGGNSSNQTNPIADVYSKGVNEEVWRDFSFNNRINIDLSHLVEGLGVHTNISFNYLNVYDQYIANNYAVYEPVWDSEKDVIIGLKKYGEDSRTGIQEVGNAYGQKRFGGYLMFDYNRTFNSLHNVSGTLLAYADNIKWVADIQGTKNANLGLRLAYNYADKYMVDFSSAVVNSTKLEKGNRVGFSPSLGLAWVISSEDFMSSVAFVDHLKLKVSGGIMNSDRGIGDYYLYDDRYSNSGSYNWYEGSKYRSGTIPNFGVNRGLFFEKRKEFNIGVEGIFFNRQLTVDANFFNSVHSDIVTRAQTLYPSYYTNYIPYKNFNKNVYRGFEVGLSYKQNIQNVSFILGANLLYSTSEVLERDEIYSNDYQYRKGHPVDARFGLVADGFFMDQQEIDNHASQAFGTVKPGDIKYIDQNNDGIIDANDEVKIGRWQAPLSFGLNLKVSYNRFTLFAKGRGWIGADGYINGSYYWVQGDDKYSAYVVNRWTEETKYTATYPRLSSISNNNNFRSSTFWLYKDRCFDLERLQLTYDIPINTENKLTMKALSVFLDGSNLLTISKHRDIRQLSIGSEPSYRSFSIGLKTSF